MAISRSLEAAADRAHRHQHAGDALAFQILAQVVHVGVHPFVLIGAALALLVTGYPFGSMAIFGLLALAGIIVNNAVLLLERIEAELADGLGRHEAVIAAAVKRLRPIVMTKLTCIVGLVPVMLFAGPLWNGMAITMIATEVVHAARAQNAHKKHPAVPGVFV